MLAQNFKSARQLRCSEADRAAAIRVLGMLERQELVQTDSYFDRIPNGFNMSVWLADEKECGTVGCIAGWMEKVKGRNLGPGCMSGRWTDLFCPRDWCRKPDTFTIERCAKALRAKLATGRADWSLDGPS